LGEFTGQYLIQNLNKREEKHDRFVGHHPQKRTGRKPWGFCGIRVNFLEDSKSSRQRKRAPPCGNLILDLAFPKSKGSLSLGSGDQILKFICASGDGPCSLSSASKDCKDPTS